MNRRVCCFVFAFLSPVFVGQNIFAEPICDEACHMAKLYIDDLDIDSDVWHRRKVIWSIGEMATTALRSSDPQVRIHAIERLKTPIESIVMEVQQTAIEGVQRIALASDLDVKVSAIDALDLGLGEFNANVQRWAIVAVRSIALSGTEQDLRAKAIRLLTGRQYLGEDVLATLRRARREIENSR